MTTIGPKDLEDLTDEECDQIEQGASIFVMPGGGIAAVLHRPENDLLRDDFPETALD